MQINHKFDYLSQAGLSTLQVHFTYCDEVSQNIGIIQTFLRQSGFKTLKTRLPKYFACLNGKLGIQVRRADLSKIA